MVRPNGWSGIGRLLQPVEDDVVRGVERLADLLQDHPALDLDVGRLEQRVQHDVGEDVERALDVRLQHPRVVGGHLLAGIGVDVAADVLDLLGDPPRGPGRRALERHVLEEVRDAVLLDPLVPAAGGEEDADRGRAQPRHRLDGDPEAVRQLVDLDASSHRLPPDHVLDRLDVVRHPRHPLRAASSGRPSAAAAPGARRRRPRPRPGTSPGARWRAPPSAPPGRRAGRRAACRPTAVCGQTTSPVAR